MGKSLENKGKERLHIIFFKFFLIFLEKPIDKRKFFDIIKVQKKERNKKCYFLSNLSKEHTPMAS